MELSVPVDGGYLWAALELRVRSFGYRDARDYWGIADPAAAFAHSALVGGTPGYRELVPDPQVPEDPAQLGGWLARNVLRPSMPLFDEARPLRSFDAVPARFR